jgi:hypothetical protein
MKVLQAITICCFLALAAFAQNAAVDGPGSPMRDDLLDHLARSWTTFGEMMLRPAPR